MSHTLLYLQIFHCCQLHSVRNISISHSVHVELSSIYVFKSIIFTVFYILHVYSVSTYLCLQSLPVDLIHVYMAVLLLLLNHKVTVKLHCIIITFLCSIFPSFYTVQGCHLLHQWSGCYDWNTFLAESAICYTAYEPRHEKTCFFHT